MSLACEQPLHFEWQAARCLTNFKLKGLNNCWRNSEQAKKKKKEKEKKKLVVIPVS